MGLCENCLDFEDVETTVLVNFQSFIFSCFLLVNPLTLYLILYRHFIQTELRQFDTSLHSINALDDMNLLSSIMEFNLDS